MRDDATGGQLVLYVFAVDRSGDTAAKILGESEGKLVVDGYTGYNAVTDPEGRSHLRRKIFEARSSSPAEAEHALELIRSLFRATDRPNARAPRPA